MLASRVDSGNSVQARSPGPASTASLEVRCGEAHAFGVARRSGRVGEFGGGRRQRRYVQGPKSVAGERSSGHLKDAAVSGADQLRDSQRLVGDDAVEPGIVDEMAELRIGEKDRHRHTLRVAAEEREIKQCPGAA